MNLVCFPDYTCGALFCDFLNKENSQIGAHNNLISANHSRAKIPLVNSHNGKGFDINLFNDLINSFKLHPNLQKAWIGTHCWAGELDLSTFDNVIQITTENKQSKIYRFARTFYTMIAGLYPNIPKPTKPGDVENYNQSYIKIDERNILNIEFEDVVEWKNNIEDKIVGYTGEPFRQHILNRKKVWNDLNSFLYDERLNYIIKTYEKFFT